MEVSAKPDPVFHPEINVFLFGWLVVGVFCGLFWFVLFLK